METQKKSRGRPRLDGSPARPRSAESYKLKRTEKKPRKHARAIDAVPAAVVDKGSLTLRFFDSATFIMVLRKLEKEANLEFYAEE